MSETFDYAPHFMVKAVRKAGITFPISKKECLEKAGDLTVRVDFDRTVPLHSVLERMVPENYDCGAAFYNAYMAAEMKAGKEIYCDPEKEG